MIPWELIDSARVPNKGGELRLYRRGREYSIMVDGLELMNSRAHGSEDALAELACARISDRPCARVLIGGLGLGYTAAASLRRLGKDAVVIVSELVPAVVEWNRGPLSDLAGHPLQDSRITVREMDVALVMQEDERAYDAILLDVDNGPVGMTSKGNNRLYSRAGLDAAYKALRPGGVLAVWSAGPDLSFTKRLSQAGFKVEEVSVRSRSAGKGEWHTIWLAERGS